MRLPILLGLFGIAGLSVLATSYALRSEGAASGLFATAHEQELQQEIDRLRKIAEELNASINRINLGLLSKTSQAGNTASQKQGEPAASAASPTPEQNAFYVDQLQRFDDPSFVRTMNLSELTKLEQVKALPDPLRQALLAKAMEKYNRGEVDEQTFLTGMAGYP